MKMKCLYAFLGLILCFFEGDAIMAQHCLSFTYDANGNRDQRHIYECLPYEETYDTQDSIRDSQEIVSEVDDADILLSPNPTNGKFYITVDKYEEQQPMILQMFDVNGTMILSNVLSEWRNEVDITNKSSGAYLIKLICGNNVRTWIILKQ